ncbi:MFS general substrate transporter [Corynespora cassiicola Philippines]|uniref:MFS general substrate transporter n=1 Tax=Corynespora cassiicola Philippines TaxID=1448308 RepID=A0A2T2NQT8_CORCC|nr:MFS general substrate transporter [Corynespora cassiicola Philippines]
MAEASSENLQASRIAPLAPETAETPEKASHQFETSDAKLESEVAYGWRFWLIISSLCVTSLLTAIEATVTATALPSISSNLNSRELYIWFVNAIFLSSAVVQPLFGQLADVFGRRWPTILSVAVFALGSGVAGGSNSAAMLIAGRTLQGVGLGGVNMLIDIIVCDLVPQRKRGLIMGIIFAVFAAGSSLGPFIGGVLVDNASWRWVFYIGLPVAGTALFLLLFFLQVEYKKETTIGQKLKRLDYIGNTILVLAMVSILLALTYGGTLRPWSSWRTILPLVLGLLGMVGFHVFEAIGWQKEPVMPPRLFNNRTSVIAFVLVFLHGMILYWVTYFLPVYFQGVKTSSPTRSGVQFLPTAIVVLPFAVIAGGTVTATGRYKPLCIVGFALQALSLGLFAILDHTSSTAEWTIFQIIGAAGIGLVTTSILPAVQVGLPESDVALSTATWGFLRSLGSIWGVSIPAAIFNNRFERLSSSIGDVEVRNSMQNGFAYEKASAAFVGSLSEPTKSQVIAAYEGALKQVWQVGIGFAILGFLIAWGMKETELKKTLDTDFGLAQKKEGKISGDSVSKS